MLVVRLCLCLGMIANARGHLSCLSRFSILDGDHCLPKNTVSREKDAVALHQYQPLTHTPLTNYHTSTNTCKTQSLSTTTVIQLPHNKWMELWMKIENHRRESSFSWQRKKENKRNERMTFFLWVVCYQRVHKVYEVPPKLTRLISPVHLVIRSFIIVGICCRIWMLPINFVDISVFQMSYQSHSFEICNILLF